MARSHHRQTVRLGERRSILRGHPSRSLPLQCVRIRNSWTGRRCFSASMSGCARIRKPNDASGWSAARWAVDQAAALGASVIQLEDLAVLETRGRRRGHARLSGQVRGTVT